MKDFVNWLMSFNIVIVTVSCIVIITIVSIGVGHIIRKKVDRVINFRLVKSCLLEDGILEIKKCFNEYEFSDTVREHYKLKKLTKVQLNETLILLNNKNCRNNTISLTAEIGIIVTLIFSLVSNTLTILGRFESIASNSVSSRTTANQQIEQYNDMISQLSNETKDNEELRNNYKNKIMEIQNKIENDTTNNKKDFIDYFDILNGIKGFVIFMFIMVICTILIKMLDQLKYENRNVATNIHKSIIEEILKELEENKKQQQQEQKKEDQMEKDIEYLKEKISEYKYKIELLEDICKVKVNSNNR